MTEWIVSHELDVRLSCFVGVLVAMAMWEGYAPRRPLATPPIIRWVNHLSISALNALLVRVLLPASAIGVAIFAEHDGWGAFNPYPVPHVIPAAGGVVALAL